MSTPQRQVVYEFEGIRLDPRRRSLSRQDGESIPVTAKVFDALLYLVEHAGEPVSRSALIEALWPTTIVEENSLNQTIWALRRAVGDDGNGQRLIVTLPGRGYQFVADVRTVFNDPPREQTSAELLPGAEATDRRRRLLPIALAAGAAAVALGAVVWHFARSDQHRVAPAKSVAVLPCADSSADAQNDLALGVHEELVEQLAKADFQVKARAAVMPYLESRRPIAEIARELDVRAVVECSVRHADGRVSVTVALADAGTGGTLWQESYDRDFADIFAIQSDVALNVAKALEAKLSPHQIAVLEDIPSRSARAIEFYYSARRYEDLGVINWPTAAAQYGRAVEEDPKFARAFAQLALLNTSMYGTVAGPPILEQAHAAAEAALKLDPNLTEGRVAMIGQGFLVGTKTAQEALNELNALEPQAEMISEFYGLRGRVRQSLGQFEGALADAQQTVALGPPRAVPLLLYEAHDYMLLGRYAEAEKIFEHVADIAPDDPGMLFHKAELPMQRDGDTRALRALQDAVLTGRMPPAGAVWIAAWMDRDYDSALRVIAKRPDDWNTQLAKGIVQQSAGHTELARPLLEAGRDALAGLVRSEPARPGLRLAYATTLSYLNEKDEALRQTREAIANLPTLPPGETVLMRLDAAYAYASAGAADLAVGELESYLSHPGEWSIEGIQRMPYFDPIRAEPAFKKLVSKYARH